MKKNCKEISSIRNLINSLNGIMTKDNGVTLESEVIISNDNFEEFEAIGVHTIKDIYYGEDKVRILIRPKEVKVTDVMKNKEIIEHEVLGKEIEETRLGGSEVEQEPVQTGSNWWEKYK